MSVESKAAIEDRIYIGNVDFKANEEDLKQFFEGLEIVDINIPSTNKKYGKKTVKKHLGFAFVQFKEKEDADKAVENFNGKEFKNRKIYVKKALPEATEEEKQKKNELFKQRKAEQAAAKAKKAGISKAAGATKSTEASENGSVKDAVKESETPAEKPSKKSTDTIDAGTKEKSEVKVPEGEPSKDVIFITNLDYKVNTKTLVNLFKEYKHKWIHVPTRRVPRHIYKRERARGNAIFNKGIAFVKFADSESQAKAIAEFNGKEINGRKIIVDVAINTKIPQDQEIKEAQEAEEKEENSKSDE